MNQTSLGTYHHIALDAIRPSPTNPRKNFDQAALDELTASIREIGVTVPVLVRPLGAPAFPGEKIQPPYELVAGQRRFLAAKAAGLTEIPAVVRELINEEAEEIQLVENLQRADLHPVEEAEGYRALLATGTRVEDVAKAVGKTTAHVQKLVKLLLLELPAKTLFHAGHLTLGHALLLARLTPADQDRAVRYLLRAEGDYKKMSTEEVLNRRIQNKEKSEWAKNSRIVDATEGALRDWISENIVLSLAKVPWSLGDADLVPEAGPCTTCPKRSGANAALFADITVEEDKCLDAACFQTKQKQSVLVTIKASADEGKPLVKLVAKTNHQPIGELKPKMKLGAGQWVEAEPMSCSSVTRGVLVEEPPRFSGSRHKVGDVITVCADQKCKVHKHHVDNPSPKGSTSSGRAVAASQAEQKKQREQKREDWLKRETEIRNAIFEDLDARGDFEYDGKVFRRLVVMLAQTDEDASIHQNAAAFACEKLSLKVKKAPTPWQQNEEASKAYIKYVSECGSYDLDEAAFYLLAGDAIQIDDWVDERDEKVHRQRLWELAKALGADPDQVVKDYLQELEEAAAKAVTPSPAKKDAAKKAPAKKTPAKKVAAKKTSAAKPLAQPSAAQGGKLMPFVDGKSAGAGARAEAGVA